MELWKPHQGTEWHSIPVLLDLLFGPAEFDFKDVTIEVWAKRARIELKLENLSICRGTKFGADIHEPYAVAEIQEAATHLVEQEKITEFSGAFDILKTFMGKFTAIWRSRRRKKKEVDYLLKTSTKSFRVAPTTGGHRWLVVEPLGETKLSGYYLGTPSVNSKSEPLCMVSMN
ncbi:unnamed protein product, partial [Ectocarpus sp. 12 AP-2014]